MDNPDAARKDRRPNPSRRYHRQRRRCRQNPAADKLSLRLPNGWTVTGYLFDRDYDPTRIPEGWTVDGILIDHDRPGNETLTLGNTFALFMV